MNVYIREVTRQLANQGIEVDVFTRSQNPEVERVVSLAPGARVIHIPAGPEAPCEKLQGWPYLPQFTRGVLDFIRADTKRYDIVHSHYWISGWAGIQVSQVLRVPHVQMFHTLGVLKNMVARSEKEKETRLRILFEKKVMDRCQLIVASSPADRAHMVWYYGADPNRIEVVPCGVDIGRFSPRSSENAKRQLQLSARQVILFVGRIQPIKGLDCLLRALSILIHRSKVASKDLSLLIIGGNVDNGGNAPNEEMKKLRALTTELGLDSVVTFLGSQPQGVLPSFYSAAEVCVLPSRYESFGMVALESMACGTPVIASRVGGLNYTIRDGQTGYLIPEGDAVALADKIDLLLTDRVLRSQMGTQGANYARKYSWQNITRHIISLYERVLTERRVETIELDLPSPLLPGEEIRSCLG
jgi:D-inositol-3-phosphate glycosyltransferase